MIARIGRIATRVSRAAKRLSHAAGGSAGGPASRRRRRARRSPGRRAPRPPAGRWRARARSRAARAPRAPGRSGRTRTGGRPRRCPGPWSRTATSPSRTLTSTSPPGGLHLAALSSRLPMARSIEPGTPLTTVSSRSGTNVTPPRFRRARSIASPATRSRRTSSRLAGLLDAVERDELGDELAHLRELLDDVGQQALPLSSAACRPRARAPRCSCAGW